jgi:hypothetical protein
MSDFDKAEWMSDNHVRPGKVWDQLRNGRPSPEFCDIRLKNNREIGPCWPRPNDFVDLSSDDEDFYLFSDVKNIRYYLPIKGAVSVNDPDDEDEEKEDEEEEDEDEDVKELDDLIPSRMRDELHEEDR